MAERRSVAAVTGVRFPSLTFGCIQGADASVWASGHDGPTASSEVPIRIGTKYGFPSDIPATVHPDDRGAPAKAYYYVYFYDSYEKKSVKKFQALGNIFSYNLGGKKHIVKEVDKRTPYGGSKENTFKKLFLLKVFSDYFQQSPVRVIIEGVNSTGETRLKKHFFNSRPVADFIFITEEKPRTLFNEGIVPTFLFDTVGELKYSVLNFRQFVTGLGQISGYLHASQFEDHPKVYGFYIFFNTASYSYGDGVDQGFVKKLWEEDNIYCLIV